MTDEINSSARLDSFPLRLTARSSVDCSRTLRRLTVNQRTTYRWSLVQEVVACEQASLGGLGLWRPKLAEFGEKRAVELIRDSGLAVSSLSWAGAFTGVNGYSFADAIDDASDALALAAELGAASLIVVSGPRGNHTRRHARRLVVEGLKHLADGAAEAGVTLVLEPMRWPRFADWTFLSAVDDTIELLDACGHDAVKLAFDTYHLGREPDLIGRLNEIAPWVGLVQWSDPRSLLAGWDESRPSEAAAPLEEITAGLLAGGYDGFFEIESWSEAVWSSDYDELLARSAARFEALCGVSRPAHA
ncbi:MAG TPA: TIM barrel protein [Planctomycetaceae bacterium]|nr:TIM barrel protein [Planctomycetaceae bacterium]